MNSRESTEVMAEIGSLRQRVAELEELVGAIQDDRVDAFLVGSSSGKRVYLLESAQRPYRALIEEVQQGVGTLDERGRVLFCNQRLATLVGKEAAQLAGEHLASAFPESCTESVRALIERARTGLVQEHVRIRRPSGADQELQVAVDLLPAESGAVFGVLLTDLSSEIAEREQSQRKNEFMALLGHELRNPLGTIRNAVAVMRHLVSTDEEQRRACDWIERQIGVMSRLIDDLLDVERIARGKIEVKFQRLELVPLVRSTCEDLRPELTTAGLTLELGLPERSIWVRGDPVRLSQVLGNLLSNAIKFSERGKSVRVALEQQGAQAVLEVLDQGAGIDAALLERMFLPFQQGRGGRGGLGLGLALVRGLVELHEGTVEAASDGVGRGACFTVRLPCA